MNAALILDALTEVQRERVRRLAEPALGRAVQQIKAYQHRRFAHTYADLLLHPRYAAAASFFLEELYGPRDFSHRDAQFAKVVPAMVRLFPRDTVETVYRLAQLHALSERMDSLMGRALGEVNVEKFSYFQAWQVVGDEPARERQIELLLGIGRTLDRLTRKPLLRRTLHLMRGPAQAAGLGQLQQFLERGFDTFKAMEGADEFLSMVGTRERALASALFRMPRIGERFDAQQNQIECPLLP